MMEVQGYWYNVWCVPSTTTSFIKSVWHLHSFIDVSGCTSFFLIFFLNICPQKLIFNSFFFIDLRLYLYTIASHRCGFTSKPVKGYIAQNTVSLKGFDDYSLVNHLFAVKSIRRLNPHPKIYFCYRRLNVNKYHNLKKN